jgi:hypothetical protein
VQVFESRDGFGSNEGAQLLESFIEQEERDGPDDSYLEGLIHLGYGRLGQGRVDNAAE